MKTPSASQAVKICKTSFALVLLLTLTNCFPPPDSEPVVLLSETNELRIIQHTFGTSEIPTDPQRVIALGEERLLADLLDAGVKPLFSIVNTPNSVSLISDAELYGIELVRSAGGVSLERLIALDPDLIIGNVFFVNEAGYGRLSDIAPTVAIGGDNPADAYIDTLTVLGLREQAEQDVATFNKQVEAEAQRLNTSEITLSVGTIYPGPSVAIWVGGSSPIPSFLTQLGVTLLPDGAERDDLGLRNGRAFISDERLDLISGERLILLQTASVEGELEAVAGMENNSIWQQLPAVETNQTTTLNRIGYPGFRGQQALLAELVEILEK